MFMTCVWEAGLDTNKIIDNSKDLAFETRKKQNAIAAYF